MDFSALLTTITTLFIMLIVGYIASKLGIIDQVASKKLSALIVNVGQPTLIIYSIIKIQYSAENLSLGLKTLAMGFAIHFIGAALALLACMKIKNLDERKLIEFSIVFGNTGFIGIPIMESLFGDVGGFMASFIVVSFNILMWTLGIAILSRKRDDIKLTLKKALINKGTVPSVIGLAVFLLPIILPSFKLPTFALSSLSYIASLCTPVSMLIIGALLAGRSFKQIFGSGKVYYLCLFKLVIIPLLVCVIMKLLGFSDMWVLFAAALTSMPSATSVSMLAELYDITPGFSAQGVGTSSLLSIATMPCVIWLAQKIIEL
jgi:predicted permease